MVKTYFNNAIIGNSKMLGCVTNSGELVRLFWPNIDYQQHIEKMVTGIFFLDQRHSTVWLSDDCWRHSQSYIADTNMIKTVCENYDRQLKVEQTDFVLPDKDVVVRCYEIENMAKHEVELGFVLFSDCVSTTPELRSTLFDFNIDSLIHYKHSSYLSFSSTLEVFQFQLGNNAFESAKHTELRGYDSIGMMKDGAVSWKLGRFMPGEKKTFNLFICVSDTLKGVRKLTASMKNSNVQEEIERTKTYWYQFLKGARQIQSGNHEIDNLYKRSLLVFKLMADEKTGGLLAAPEVDETFTRCGRYAYCWGRDAAFITNALDKSGLCAVVDKFYHWAVDVQEEDGSWQQRYHMDGNLAPSWGMQVDETGTLVWGMLKHYENTKDLSFLSKVWSSVKKGVNFLVGFMDEETGLPKPSYDLWEERIGEHTYSCAAVYGGIAAGIEIASVLNITGEDIECWKKTAKDLKQSMVKHLWKEDYKRFIRSARVKLNPWGREHSQHIAMVKVNPKGYQRDVTLEDWIVDVSLLGVSIPFGVFDAHDDKVSGTVELIEKVLTCPGVGGIKRYENDNYIGGNPWVLTTLWVALYYIERKEYMKARQYFEWAAKCRTELDLLPEQVSRDDGKPAWIIPLTWSHAMFVLVLIGLHEAGAL